VRNMEINLSFFGQNISIDLVSTLNHGTKRRNVYFPSPLENPFHF
jgi:hypothetical protein